MARRLEEANERVAVLALFDAGITTALLEGRHARLPSLLAGARVILKNLYYLKLPTSYAQVRWLGQAVGISLPRSCREVWRRDLSSQSRFWRTIGRGILSSLRVSVNNFIAIRNYRPGAFHGEVTLFRATNSTRRRDTLIEGLTKLAPERLTVRHVPGNHMAIILDRAHVRGLAEELRSCLNRAGVDDPATTKDAHSERRAAEATIEASQLVK
jgi:thioesterase domain-containing protein